MGQPILGNYYFGTFDNSSATLVVSGMSISAGSAVLVFLQIFDPSDVDALTGFTDSAGNTYTRVSGPDRVGAVQRTYLYICDSSSGSISTLTATLNNPQYSMLVITEVKSPATNPIDNFVFASGTGNPFLVPDLTPSTFTTTFAPDLLLTVGGSEQANYSIEDTGGFPTAWTTLINENDATNQQCAWLTAATTATTITTGQFTCNFTVPLFTNAYLVAMAAGTSSTTIVTGLVMLYGGTFQTLAGVPISNGKLKFELSNDTIVYNPGPAPPPPGGGGS
jgi:hypothetical protein